MGYNTKFSGALQLSRALTMPEAAAILEINEDPDSVEGEHPDSYMQWVPSETLDHIVYDGGEKFYQYVPWLKWLMAHLGALGVVANGCIHWSGEEAGDTGTINVVDSVVTVAGKKTPARDSHRPLDLRALEAMALKQITSAA